jgi:hypothetical protein
MLSIAAIWINAPMDTSDHGLSHHFKDPGATATAMAGIKNPVMYLFGAKYRGIVKVPHRKRSKFSFRTNVGSVSRYLFADIQWHKVFARFYFGEFSLKFYPSILVTPCMYVCMYKRVYIYVVVCLSVWVYVCVCVCRHAHKHAQSYKHLWVDSVLCNERNFNLPDY